MPQQFKVRDIQQYIRSTLIEMNKATAKHPVWPECPVRRAAIISEEAGEVIREANHLLEGHGDRDLLIKELIQTAGTCFRMLYIMDQDPDAKKPLEYYDILSKLKKDNGNLTHLLDEGRFEDAK